MPIVLRFMQGSEPTSRLIVALEKQAMPFTPSHVEAVTPDGFYLGSHIVGGTEERKPGYDEDTTVHELFLTLQATDEQSTAFYADMRSHIGEPYDWRAILGFIIPDHEHIPQHAICSARVTLSLRAAKWFPYPLAAPAHLIDPRDLLLMLSAQVQVPM
jgi:hypothetical protein